jgi:hypothetical protein
MAPRIEDALLERGVGTEKTAHQIKGYGHRRRALQPA